MAQNSHHIIELNSLLDILLKSAYLASSTFHSIMTTVTKNDFHESPPKSGLIVKSTAKAYSGQTTFSLNVARCWIMISKKGAHIVLSHPCFHSLLINVTTT